jgi:hypothetical protein
MRRHLGPVHGTIQEATMKRLMIVLALVAFAPIAAQAADLWEFEGDQDWQTIVRTIDATRERQQKLGVPLSDKDYEDLKENMKPGYREYKIKMVTLEQAAAQCRKDWPTDYKMQMSCTMDVSTKLFAPETMSK